MRDEHFKGNTAVHDGYRNQHPDPVRPSRLGPEPEITLNKVGCDELSASMTAARLAAEAAFAAPVRRTEQIGQTLVVVRRARLAAPANGPVVSKPGPSDTDRDHKVPRVFRVGPTPAAHAVGAAPDPAPTPHSLPEIDVTTASSPRPRRRRRSGDKLPGPVLHVVRDETPLIADQPGDPRLKELMAELINVGHSKVVPPPLQPFCVPDQRILAAWENLAQRVEALREEVRARRR